jgi:mRNA interferase MazF
VYAGKPRPVIVLQSDIFSDTDSVTVLPLTTTDSGAPMLREPITPNKDNGLTQQSWVMVDKVTTIHRQRLGQPVGHTNPEVMRCVRQKLMVFLGLDR